jgi:hypothetical protein
VSDQTAFEDSEMIMPEQSFNQVAPRKSAGLSQLIYEPTSPKHLKRNKPPIVPNHQVIYQSELSERSVVKELDIHRVAKYQNDVSSVSSMSIRSIDNMMT